MRRGITLSIGLLGALVCVWSPLSAAEYGSLKGQFIHDGPAPAQEKINIPPGVAPECAKHAPMDLSLLVGSDGGISNVVVYLQAKAGQKIAVHPDYEKTAKDEAKLDNHNCEFKPHVLAMRTTQKLIITNSDDFGHNTKAEMFANTPFNVIIPAKGSVPKSLANPERVPVPVACNIHPFMTGYLVVRPDPYFAVSGEDGSFTIEKIPAGTYDVVIWHERQAYMKEATIGGAKTVLRKGRTFYSQTIKAGDNDLGQIKVDPLLMNKKSS